MAPAVVSSRIQNVGALSTAETAEPFERLVANTIVLTHTSTSTVQPPNRCVASNLSWFLLRKLGRAMNTITRIRLATTDETTTTARSTPPLSST